MPLIVIVGSTVGLSIMGDSLLYSILPLEAEDLGISLPQVGILLSANRLIRLLSNTWASSFYERLGPRAPFIGSAVLGAVATVLYGLGWGFAALLLARVIWGIAWSGLRQGGYQAIWAAGDQVKGRMTGILFGLVRLGSAIGVLFGGYLYDGFGFSTAIGAVMVMALLAVPVSSVIRWPIFERASETSPRPGHSSADSAEADPTEVDSVDSEQIFTQPITEPIAYHRLDLQLRKLGRGWLSVLEKPVHRWLIGATFCDLLLNSVVVATTSLFIASKVGADQNGLTLGLGVATVTGILHGVRWLTDLTVGPALGHLSDLWGQSRMAFGIVVVLLLSLLGAVTLPAFWAILCLLIVFLGKGSLYVVLSAAAAGEATETVRPHLFMSTYATASDAGSAIGPLFAFSIGSIIGLPTLYLGVGLLLGLVLFQYRRHAQEGFYGN
ncbi:MAG: MFS transporter [Chloroflexota bacterium]